MYGVGTALILNVSGRQCSVMQCSRDHLVTLALSHSNRDIASLVSNDCHIVWCLTPPSPHLLIHLMRGHWYYQQRECPCRLCMKSDFNICNWMEKLIVQGKYGEIKQIVQFREHLQIWKKIFLSMNIIMPKPFYAISSWRFILNQIILWCRVLSSFSHNVKTSKNTSICIPETNKCNWGKLEIQMQDTSPYNC